LPQGPVESGHSIGDMADCGRNRPFPPLRRRVFQLEHRQPDKGPMSPAAPNRRGASPWPNIDQPVRKRRRASDGRPTLRRRWIIIKPLIGVIGTALLLVACESQPRAQATPPPPLSIARPPSYMLFFDWDKSTLWPEAMATIGRAAATYKSSGSARIVDVGITDTSGSPDCNTALSLRRADAVKLTMKSECAPLGPRIHVATDGSALDPFGRTFCDMPLASTGRARVQSAPGTCLT